jgi:hypothetical protein
MTATAPFNAPVLGSDGDTCRGCGNPLATDQRYCLECGTRRGDTRVPFGDPAPASVHDPASPTAAVPAPERGSEWTPLTAIGLVAVIALILLAGILVGQGLGGDGDGARVVTVGGAGARATTGGGGSTETAAFESDWPSGKEGWTVELGSLDKGDATAADVQSAKDDATGKGAPEVGALDSDEYASLPGGKYVVYSGVYDSEGAATKALGGLKEDFPDARVAKVSTEASADSGGGGGGGTPVGDAELQELDNATGDAYVEQSKKLPDETAVEGKPPPKDEKAPGGGGAAIEIK